MTITQAKKIAGIAAGVRISGRSALESAMDHCVGEIILARKQNDDARAAALSEAKEVFKSRLHGNAFAMCGTTIGRGATHCRIHRNGVRAKALPAPPEWQQSQKPRRATNNNARVVIYPRGGHPAMLGYYTKPIRKVVARWQAEIGEETLKHYFGMVAMPLHYPGINLHVHPKTARHWQAIFELGVAITTLWNDNKSAESWLLRQPYIEIGGSPRTWALQIAEIVERGGPHFTENVLKQTAKRMLLETPREVAACHRLESQGLCDGSIKDPQLYSVVSKQTHK